MIIVLDFGETVSESLKISFIGLSFRPVALGEHLQNFPEIHGRFSVGFAQRVRNNVRSIASFCKFRCKYTAIISLFDLGKSLI